MHFDKENAKGRYTNETQKTRQHGLIKSRPYKVTPDTELLRLKVRR